MKVWVVSVLLCLVAVLAWAGTPGEFRGTVVAGPDSSATWLYVQGRNHSIRRVNVSGAKVRYDSEVPASQRKVPVPKALPNGTQVRITAEQDEAGEWKASEVEILKAETPDEKKPATSTTTKS